MKKIVLVVCVLVFNNLIFAQGDLLITPARVVFEGTKQKEVLSLYNTGKETATYSISFVQKSMKEDGSFVNVEATDSLNSQHFADPYLRMFPRKVTLAPKESQTVLLQYRRGADMSEGEYRSHLYFRSEKDYKALQNKSTARDSTLLSVQLIPIYGISIPVIIRNGKIETNASLSDLKIEVKDNKIGNFKFTINRLGNSSLYGDIKVEYITKDGVTHNVALVKGVGVYTSIEKRSMTVSIDTSKIESLESGKLKVIYTSNGEGKSVVYAQGELEI
jgi:hypothetical protein